MYQSNSCTNETKIKDINSILRSGKHARNSSDFMYSINWTSITVSATQPIGQIAFYLHVITWMAVGNFWLKCDQVTVLLVFVVWLQLSLWAVLPDYNCYKAQHLYTRTVYYYIYFFFRLSTSIDFCFCETVIKHSVCYMCNYKYFHGSNIKIKPFHHIYVDMIKHTRTSVDKIRLKIITNHDIRMHVIRYQSNEHKYTYSLHAHYFQMVCIFIFM